VRTDGQKYGRKKASHDISPVHSIHLADITKETRRNRNVTALSLVRIPSVFWHPTCRSLVQLLSKVFYCKTQLKLW